MSISVDLESDYAELVLDVGALTLGEKSRMEMEGSHRRKKETVAVSRAVCALLNSGGGVIKAKIENQCYSFIRDGIGIDLEKSLENMLTFVPKYLDFVQDEDHFYIFVKSWIVDISGLLIVTLKTNLYTRSMSSSVGMKPATALEFLRDMKKTGGRQYLRTELCAKRASIGVQEECQTENLAALFFNRTKLPSQGEFSFTNSALVEIKLCPMNQLVKFTKEFLPRTVSAFANTDGGYLFIGLDGKKQQIIGFKAEKSDCEQLERQIENCIRQLPVHHVCEEKQGIKYECKFIEVHDSGGVCSYVLALRVERFCCAVFAEQPDSWHVEDNCVKPFTTEEWVQSLMTDVKPG